MRRHLAPYRQAIDLAATLGQLREIRVAMGAGELFWVHPHSVDMILAVAGPRRLIGVQARLGDTAATGPITNDPAVLHASLWFEDGVAGLIGRATGYDLTIDCANGAVTVANDGAEVSLRVAAGNDPYPVVIPIPLDPTTTPQGTAAALVQLVAALEGDPAAVAANAEMKADILRAQRALFAMVQSHRQGGAIVAPEAVDPALEIWAETGGRPA